MSPRAWTGVVVLGTSMLLSFQGGLLRIALPVIRTDLDADIAAIQAVGLAALAAISATLVIAGRLADLVGPRRVHTIGLVVFSAGGLGAAAAPATGWLVAWLALQGLGWSMAVAAGTAQLVGVFEPGEHGRVLAAQHSAIAVGLAAGPAGGGLVVDTLGWRWGFTALAGAGLLLAAGSLTRLAERNRPRERPRFDVPGAALLAAALLALLMLLERGGAGALDARTTVGLAVVTGALVAAFLAAEARAPEPVVDLRLFRRRGFSAGLAASFTNFVAMTAHMFLLPFVLQDHLGHSAARAGALLVTAPVVILLTAPAAGLLADRLGPRAPATAGQALVAGAVALMATFGPGTPLAWIIAVLVVYGLGAALFQSPNSAGVLAAVPAERVGVASGTLSTVGRLGQVAGIAVAGWAWQAGLVRHGGAAGPAFRDAFLLLAAFGVVAVVASWLRGPGRGSGRPAAASDLGP